MTLYTNKTNCQTEKDWQTHKLKTGTNTEQMKTNVSESSWKDTKIERILWQNKRQYIYLVKDKWEKENSSCSQVTLNFV